ncbi:MAG: isopeptide-forming domain-containing fimbrial protein, partial [Chloroflexi bacterium]|nr:isopeptide-forming domain-containing fimbrial protein [Chloroflexota bacterium]
MFDPAGGLELTDPGPTATPEGALDPYHPTSGRNIAIILYDAQLTSAVRPLENLVNTATLYHYAGVEGGPDHTLTDRTDTATVSVAAPRAGKQLVGTEINLAPNDNTEAVIGEMITYTLRVTIPEGTTPNATIVDTLDDGLAFVDFVPGFTNSNPAEVTLSGSTTPVITNNGRTITWNLGTITNTNTDNA